MGREILQVLRYSGPASDETLVTEESANSQPESRMREIRKSGSEGGARQTNVSFLPLSGPADFSFLRFFEKFNRFIQSGDMDPLIERVARRSETNNVQTVQFQAV